MKKITILAVFIVFSFTALSQTSPEFKVAAAPSKENEKLIDKLIKVSKFKKYYIEYCNQLIDSSANVYYWSPGKIKKQKAKVNFEDFRDDIYNAYSFTPKEELLNLIDRCKNITNPDSLPWVILGNSMISNNLPLYVAKYLK